MNRTNNVSERVGVGCYRSPLGVIWIAASDAGLRVVTVPGATYDDCLHDVARKSPGGVSVVDGGVVIEQAVRELTGYFEGSLRCFSVALDLCGTPFQRRVWRAVCQVPYGKTATYGDIAKQIGAPHAYRAVGAANGANPAAIIVPCHRLIGVSGSLRGYGGGLHQKRALLDLEASHGAG